MTTTQPTSTTTIEPATSEGPVKAAPSFPTPDYDVETRITAFAGLTDGFIGVFRPVGDGSVMAAITDKSSVVGYLTDPSGAVIALGVHVPWQGETKLEVPARLLGIVGSSGVDADDALAATEAFQTEVLPELGQLDLPTTFADNPYFRLTVSATDGILFVFEPVGDGPYHGTELQSLAELAE